MKINHAHTYIRGAALLLLLLIVNKPFAIWAQGTQFTYQGRLNDGTNPANGRYDFQFQVFDVLSGGSSYGSPNPNPFTGVPVSNGLFTVVLDFGTGVFAGSDRWLEIKARTNGAVSFGTLTPRQKLTPTPYAIYAGNAAQVGGQTAGAFVLKAGDTMTGTLNLPANGLNVAGGQLFVSGGNAYVGNALNVDYWGNNNGSVNPGLTFGFASGEGIASKRTGGGNQYGIDFYAGGQPRMSIVNGGSVGVGTDQPEHTFDVNGDVAVRGTLLVDSHDQNDGSGDIPGIIFGDYNSYEVISSQRGTNGPNRYGLDLRTAGQRRLSIANGGNVGIGTPAPEARLHVMNGSAGTVTANANSIAVLEQSGFGYLSLLTPAASESGILFGDPNNNADGGVVFNNVATPGGLQFRTGGNSVKLVVQSDGNVGIGTSSPLAPLHVFGGNWDVANTEGDFRIGNATYRLKMGVANAGGGAGDARIHADGGTGSLILGSGTVDTVLINSNKVGINTFGPSASLDVNGDTRVRGLLRSGSETGTSQTPNPATGLVIRRINSNNKSLNQILARNDKITLERDGSNGGMLIRYTGALAHQTVAAMGITSSGAVANFFTTLSPAGAGTTQIYTDAQTVVYFRCMFGDPFDLGHQTEVVMTREASDYFWAGTVTSTYNQ